LRGKVEDAPSEYLVGIVFRSKPALRLFTWGWESQTSTFDDERAGSVVLTDFVREHRRVKTPPAVDPEEAI